MKYILIVLFICGCGTDVDSYRDSGIEEMGRDLSEDYFSDEVPQIDSGQSEQDSSGLNCHLTEECKEPRQLDINCNKTTRCHRQCWICSVLSNQSEPNPCIVWNNILCVRKCGVCND